MADSDKPNNELLDLNQLKSIKVALWTLVTVFVILPVIAGIGTGVVIGFMALTADDAYSGDEEGSTKSVEKKESEEKLEWEVLTETDVFPGDNAHTMPAGDLDACKQVCIDRQFGAFVTWRGTAYFRSQSPEDCKSHSEPGIHGGSTLYIRPATQNLEVGTSTSRADADIATGTEPTSETKEPPANVGKELKPDDVVGSYEAGLGGITFRFVLLESGVVENYFNGIKEPEDAKWKIRGAEVHIEKGKSDGTVIVNKIEPNGDFTVFARIRNGKREDFQNRTYKKNK